MLIWFEPDAFAGRLERSNTRHLSRRIDGFLPRSARLGGRVAANPPYRLATRRVELQMSILWGNGCRRRKHASRRAHRAWPLLGPSQACRVATPPIAGSFQEQACSRFRIAKQEILNGVNSERIGTNYDGNEADMCLSGVPYDCATGTTP